MLGGSDNACARAGCCILGRVLRHRIHRCRPEHRQRRVIPTGIPACSLPSLNEEAFGRWPGFQATIPERIEAVERYSPHDLLVAIGRSEATDHPSTSGKKNPHTRSCLETRAINHRGAKDSTATRAIAGMSDVIGVGPRDEHAQSGMPGVLPPRRSCRLPLQQAREAREIPEAAQRLVLLGMLRTLAKKDSGARNAQDPATTSRMPSATPSTAVITCSAFMLHPCSPIQVVSVLCRSACHFR